LISSETAHKPRKVDTAYEQLRRMIVTLELEPGTAVDERTLMEHLEIGRTPLREAIQRLAHEGLITHTPRRGSWVSPLSFTELQHVIDARRMLEVECARLAAINISPLEIEQLREQVLASSDAVRGGDAEASVFVDQVFHRQIACGTGNRYLVRMIEQLQHELLRYWYVSSMRVGNLGPIVDHHLTLIEAIASGDTDTAAEEMDQHVTMFQVRLGNLVGGIVQAAAL
jgi:GntR family transcriptional regulator, rspAB operon transcriptional repressor